MRSPIRVTGFRTGPNSPGKRERGWLLWLSFVMIGVAVGLWRTPPPSGAPEIPQAIAEERTVTGSRSLGEPGIPDPATPLTNVSQVKLVTYTVRDGDTLSSIARMFNTDADSIASLNDLASPDRISVGKEISIMANASGVVTKVASGDTLSDIASAYGISVNDIMQANNLSSADDIQVGQTLLLPGAKPGVRRPQVVSRGSSSFIWPAEGSITSVFGWRIHPVTGEEQVHEGIDIANSTETEVHAAGSGTVTFAGWYGGYGRLIIISHGDGIETRYGHLSGYEVSQGDYVSAGELIGYLGSSGTATGPNLHFEVRLNGTPVNPRDYLP